MGAGKPFSFPDGRGRLSGFKRPKGHTRGGAKTPDKDMFQQFDQFQKMHKDNVDAMLKSFGAVSKGAQAIAVETSDYAKKYYENSVSIYDKMLGAKSLDKAVEVFNDHSKSIYEAYVAQSSKIGEIYANIAKEAFKPYEGFVAKAQAAGKNA